MSLDFTLQRRCREISTGELVLVDVFHRNITHNVRQMWIEAKVYQALYVSGGMKAHDVIHDLEKGLEDMLARPAFYKLLDPPNGWGDYDSALNFLKDVLQSCRIYPHAVIHISK